MPYVHIFAIKIISVCTCRQESGKVRACCPAASLGRSKVDGLRRERLLFDDVLRKSERQWKEQRGEMVALIQETSAAHEQRSKVGAPAHPGCTTSTPIGCLPGSL